MLAARQQRLQTDRTRLWGVLEITRNNIMAASTAAGGPDARQRTTQTGGLVSRDITADHIDFAVGQPNPRLLPLEHIATAAAHRLQGPAADKLILQYGSRQGSYGFRERLAGYLTEHYNYPVAAADLLLTAGVSQGLDLACRTLLQPGDLVLVELPTYFLAKGIFESCRLHVRGVPSDEEGMMTDVLEQMITEQGIRPAAVYTIPVHNNPTGTTLPPARRLKLLQLAQQHGFYVLADEVYQLLSFPSTAAPPQPMRFWERQQQQQQQQQAEHGATDAPAAPAAAAAGGPPTAPAPAQQRPAAASGGTSLLHDAAAAAAGSCAGAGNSRVVSFGSFSKIMAPGLRLGWVEASEHIMAQLKQDGSLSSGGCMVSLPVGIMHSAMELGLLQQHLRQAVLPALQAQAAAMVAALQRHLPSCSFVMPQGGYFVWLRLPEGADAAVLLQRAAAAHEVKFLPGSACMGTNSCLRLSFAFYTIAEIEDGVERLSRALKEHIELDVCP